MASVNKAILLGHVGADPSIRAIGDSERQNKAGTFSLATTKRYRTSSGEQQESTQWHNVAVYGNIAEIAEKYVRKGSLVYIEGEIRYRKYTDRQGAERYVTEVMADRIQLLDRKGDSDSTGPASRRPGHTVQSQPVPVSSDDDNPEDDLPF